MAIVSGCVWCGACVARCVRVVCFGRFEDLDELSGGDVRCGSFGIAGAEEPGRFDREEVGFGNGVDRFGFCPSSVEEVENVERELFVCGSRCGGVRDGCSQYVGDAGRLEACRGCEKGDVRCEIIRRLFEVL